MNLKTKSFILELPLKTTASDEKELLSRFESARQLYNACLGECIRKVKLIQQSKLNHKAKQLPKTEKNKKERKELFQIAKTKYGFNEYYFHKYIGILRHKIKNSLDIQTVQKLATRAFHASEKVLYGQARKVRFKGYNQLNTVESKSNVSGIRWKNNRVEWNKLSLIPIIDINDAVVNYGLAHKVKYCRLLRKIIRGKNYFYVQLVLEGVPLVKEKNRLGQGIVCFDIGPSTIAIVSKNEDRFSGELKQFCSELDTKSKEIKTLQRKIDRQRRKNNPENYDENNKIKKGKKKWVKSNRQIECQNELKELHREISEHRKSLQGKLINETLRKGNEFKTEKFSKKWLQKKYGKSIGRSAPGMFVSGMKRKAESAGASFMEFSTKTTKLSQTCFCGRQKIKKLSERVHDCDCGVHAQRDLFSAFLGIFVNKNAENYVLQADQARNAWSSADKLLQTAWRNAVESAIGGKFPSSFGSKAQSQSRSFAKEGIAKFEVQNVVPVVNSGVAGVGCGESLKENKVVSFRTYGVLTPVECQDSNNKPIFIPEFYCNKNGEVIGRGYRKDLFDSEKLITEEIRKLYKDLFNYEQLIPIPSKTVIKKYVNEVINTRNGLKYIYVCRRKNDRCAIGIVGSKTKLRISTPKELSELRKTLIKTHKTYKKNYKLK